MQLMLDRGLDVVRRDRGCIAEDLALGRLGLGSRGAEKAGGSRASAAHHHGRAGLDGHGLAHNRALLSHMHQAVGGHGGPGGLLGERAKRRRRRVAQEGAGFGGEFHGAEIKVEGWG